ncbi:ComF family protein [Ornithinibacillus salinisoli]|uniref:ComF family protein n=1 Tax=Ornithinibacillus salinisoli TaxID=1848459 RepID=A0ABW4W1P1_9BACI
MNCLWCDEEIRSEVCWVSLVLPLRSKSLCQSCERELKVIRGNRCSRCSRASSSTICEDCIWWEQYMGGEDVLSENYSVFTYNERMQDMITKWKYRGDYQLGYAFKEIFVATFQQKFKTSNNMVALSVPLSEERILERSFNQAEMLVEFLPIISAKGITREHGEKQSKKTRQERIRSENPFKLQKPINKPVILVDDIYTTGTTLRHAARLLKQHGCPKIYAYTLIRG